MQLFTHGQWWSIFVMHRLQMRQWWARGGLKALHLLHRYSVLPDDTSACVGSAAGGTVPGSVKATRTWLTIANASSVLNAYTWRM